MSKNVPNWKIQIKIKSPPHASVFLKKVGFFSYAIFFVCVCVVVVVVVLGGGGGGGWSGGGGWRKVPKFLN